MQRVQTRQPGALEHLHARYQGFVRHVAVGILPDPNDVQEVTQDVFLELWNRAGNFDARRGRLRGWIGALAYRRALDQHRRNCRRTTGYEAIKQEWGRTDWQRGNAADAFFSIDGTMADERKILLGVIGTLPPEQAQAVFLTYFMEMSQRELARHLRIPLGVAKHRLVLALRVLTKQSAELRGKLARDR